MCQRCGNASLMKVGGKCSDMYTGDHSTDGYVPHNLGIGGGDYINFILCLGCGQIQGQWPKVAPVPEEDNEE